MLFSSAARGLADQLVTTPSSIDVVGETWPYGISQLRTIQL